MKTKFVLLEKRITHDWHHSRWHFLEERPGMPFFNHKQDRRHFGRV